MAELHVFSRLMWIYIDSPALYIARSMSSVPPDRSEVLNKLYYAVEFFSMIEASCGQDSKAYRNALLAALPMVRS